jgi:hypothetical protein
MVFWQFYSASFSLSQWLTNSFQALRFGKNIFAWHVAVKNLSSIQIILVD